MMANASVEIMSRNPQCIVSFAPNYARGAYKIQDKQKGCFSVIF